MFLLDIDGEKDQSPQGKENLTSEKQKAFTTCINDQFPQRNLEQYMPSHQGIYTFLASSDPPEVLVTSWIQPHHKLNSLLWILP